MPRMQVYLPTDLYEQVKTHGLPASELLQEAVRAEIRRRELLAHLDEYIDELTAEIGSPSSAELERADAIARRITARIAEEAS